MTDVTIHVQGPATDSASTPITYPAPFAFTLAGPIPRCGEKLRLQTSQVPDVSLLDPAFTGSPLDEAGEPWQHVILQQVTYDLEDPLDQKIDLYCWWPINVPEKA